MSQLAAVSSASLARSSPRCQACSSIPRLPSGSSRLCSGPATKPSSEIDIWHVVSCTNTLPSGCDLQAKSPPKPSDSQPQGYDRDYAVGGDDERRAQGAEVAAAVHRHPPREGSFSRPDPNRWSATKPVARPAS